jgi:hypothetical protein
MDVPAAPAPLDAVVTHHTDGFRSGVARFNELLGLHLQIPRLRLDDARLDEARHPLLSFKISELPPPLLLVVETFVSRARTWEVFLHEYAGLELERRVVEGAMRVHCGNREIYEAVRDLNKASQPVWTPGLLNDDRRFPDVDITVFSFGMAHKIRTDMFGRLRMLLEKSGRSYALYVSAANHETASLGDAEQVFRELNTLFANNLFFLGTLSDVAVAHWLRTCTFFAAFFSGGVRGNNTSVASAMDHGAVVVTNLDRYSPPEFVHMENMLDIEQCDALPTDRLLLEELSMHATGSVRARDWTALVARLR